MFTGIIETIGIVEAVMQEGTNKIFTIASGISSTLQPDQSVSHDGVCMTVTSVNENTHTVTAIAETLSKTCLATWQRGRRVNLERCLQINGRLDGHFVQGHADTTAQCIAKVDSNGSWLFTFETDRKFRNLIVEKGSISINGISLTIFDITENRFSVAIIPYTYDHTNIADVEIGGMVNIEFDIIGKYILRSQNLNTP